jgi:OFA family oxalate/formate antiporter-like MFS transporter
VHRRRRPFLQLYAAQFVMSFVILLPFVHLVPAAMDMNIARVQAVILVALIGFGSNFGRIIFEGITDRLGRKPTQVCLFASLGACYLLWLLAQSFVMLLAFALVFGVLYGGLAASYATVPACGRGSRGDAATRHDRRDRLKSTVILDDRALTQAML